MNFWEFRNEIFSLTNNSRGGMFIVLAMLALAKVPFFVLSNNRVEWQMSYSHSDTPSTLKLRTILYNSQKTQSPHWMLLLGISGLMRKHIETFVTSFLWASNGLWSYLIDDKFPTFYALRMATNLLRSRIEWC